MPLRTTDFESAKLCHALSSAVIGSEELATENSHLQSSVGCQRVTATAAECLGGDTVLPQSDSSGNFAHRTHSLTRDITLEPAPAGGEKT
jgi:hypothetical protein